MTKHYEKEGLMKQGRALLESRKALAALLFALCVAAVLALAKHT